MPHIAPDVLVLAAHPIELEPFGALLAAHSAGVSSASVGVGMAAAGIGALAALMEKRPRVVVLVGSYGVYAADATSFQPGRLLIPTTVVALDASVLAGHAALPGPMQSRTEPDPHLSAALAALDPSADRAPLATTLAITSDDTLAARLGRDGGCAGENLEALPVGLACAHVGVPYACVLGCTNVVGSRGRQQWREHHPLAAQATARLIGAWLERGAPTSEAGANAIR